tara:strand:- start:627 stop:1106 length:480 start_codon:yes stop_codon:yes gene_type:complete
VAIKNKALEAYGEVKVASGVGSSDNVQLIQMLLDGLIENLSAAEGQVHRVLTLEAGEEHRTEIANKNKTLTRAANIVMGLQTALDHDKGGELAKNLNELYAYVSRKIFTVNANNDLDALKEIKGLMENIRSAWKQVPALVPGAKSEGQKKLSPTTRTAA